MPAARRADPPEVRLPLVLRRLTRAYPDARIALEFSTPLECVVATILSAQATDVGVNQVTRSLFEKYRRPEDYLAVPEEELQADIHPTGFFRQKTRALRGMAQRLLDAYDGEVPKTIRELVTLPGVARKTANIVQGNCWPEVSRRDPDAGMAVDTHVGRLAVDLIARKDRHRATNLFIEHGRRVCVAKSPRCADCVVEPLCPSSQEAGLPDLYRVAESR